MTQKEKAKDIYCKYTEALNIIDLQTTTNPFAKQCSLITVDEILSVIWIDLDDSVDYWAEVKQEIENI